MFTYLSCLDFMLRTAVRFYADYRDHSALNERLLCIRSLFESDFHPLVSVQMKDDHVLTHHSVFWLTPVDDHRSFVGYGWVVLSHTNRNSFGLKNVYGQTIAVVLNNLVSALPNLPFPIEHEAATEHHDLALVLNSRVTLAALNNLLRTENNLLPGNWITHDLCSRYFFDWLIVHSANHIHWLANLSDSSTLTRWGNPRLPARLNSHFSSESLSLLHPLYVALQPSSKFLC